MKYQHHVHVWSVETVGFAAATDLKERAARFLEEALELAQAAGLTEANVEILAGYVFNRPTGELPQEIGGTYLTLASLAQAAGVDMEDRGWAELTRVQRPEIIEKVRRKQATKPHFSVLPGRDA
jgi:hypothetical protein